MTEKKDMVLIHANIDITAAALQAIVENAKKITGRNEKGHYRVDTAEKVSEMISRFLLEKDFESYAGDINNFTE